MDQGINVPEGLFLAEDFRPAITTWDRLEGRPRKEDFDRSLKAEVRDPLWMLCRQWQFGEFNGEDAGSAILAKVQIDTARINRYAVREGAVPYDDSLPLEARVERENVPMDLATRVQAGRHWLKLLALHVSGDLKNAYLGEYPIEVPSDEEQAAHLFSDRRAWQMFAAVQGRVVDGATLLEAIGSGEHETWVNGTSFSAADKAGALEAAAAFVDWFGRIYNEPEDPEDTAWAPSYLEYQFACSAPADSEGDTQTVLVAEGYHQGHLDWYSFDIDSRPGARLEDQEGVEIPGGVLRAEEPITFIPNAIEYGGMPRVRWWEFEDGQTDFGNVKAGTTDLALLMLTEFGLIYGNDWSLLPYNLEVGTLAEIRGIVVTDVFGVRTFIRAAGTRPDEVWQRWSVYNLNTTTATGCADTRLFLPPATGKMQEGAPIERVILARDEMANMVWGIESIVPGVIGQGIAGYEAATDLARHLTPETPPAPPIEPLETEAEIQYKLGTTVAENWIPFIAVHKPDSSRQIRLQRAAMPRLTDEDPNSIVNPRGAILRHGLDSEPTQPYFIHEEEVPRSGAIVSRSYQRTRWRDGRIYTWLGRRKRTGRGEGSSGLQFDQIVPKEVVQSAETD